MFTVLINLNKSHCDCIHKGKNEKKKYNTVIDICLIFIKINYSINALRYIIVLQVTYFLALNTTYKIADNNTSVIYKHSTRIFDILYMPSVFTCVELWNYHNEYKD